MTRGRARRLAGSAAAALAASALAVALAAPASSARPKPAPNFLLVLVDDQASDTFKPALMPDIYRWIVDPGTKFSAGLAAPPLCCPDRAGILTGQYPHDDGVFSNAPGYPSLNDKGDTLPVWLHNAGYRTGFVGKFLNHYSDYAGDAPAPGFDRWFGFTGAAGYYDYGVSDNGVPTAFGSGRQSYSTSVLTARARNFIRHSASGAQPFFLWLAYNAPHDTRLTTRFCGGSSPIPQSGSAYRRYEKLPLPRPPNFNEANVSDKPPWIANQPPLTREKIHEMARRYRCTAAAMHNVDADVGKVMKQLKRTGALRNTIVLYLSDNGYFFGEHRISRGKSWPYEPALRVPYAIRVPAAYRNRKQRPVVKQVVSNTDVAPTILDYAGGVTSCATATDCRTLDGRSMRPLLAGGGSWPASRGVLAEIDSSLTTYAAIRTKRYMYAEYAGGQRELYNLVKDRFERRNVAGDPNYAHTQASLAHRLDVLRHCSGTAGPNACE